MRTYGYVRVSSTDQNEDRQLIAMENAGVPRDCVYVDKRSGKDFERPQYQKMVKRLREGDVLYILSIDRLGRDYAEVQEQWRVLTKEIGVDICVLDMPLLDTRQGKDLMGTFIADLVLQVLSFVAESERSSIRQRQAEGIEAARTRGVRFGRPGLTMQEEHRDVYLRYKAGDITLKEGAEECGLPISTFRYRARAYTQSNQL